MPINIPAKQEMTPALFAIFEAHPPDVVNEHWKMFFVPMLDREDELYNISVGHYFLFIRSAPYTKRQSADMYPLMYCQLTDKAKLEIKETQALNYIANEYWDILTDSWKTSARNGNLASSPPRSDAVQEWLIKKDNHIKARLTQLKGFFARLEGQSGK